MKVLKDIHKLWGEQGFKQAYNYGVFKLYWSYLSPCVINHISMKTPRMCEIETTTSCNLRCKICEHTYWNEPSTDMSLQEFKNIIDQFPKLRWIGLTGIGEAFIDSNKFLKMLEYVKKKHVFVELYDSFFFIDRQVSKHIVELGINQFFISLDAATKKTYEDLRVGSNFEKVCDNIQGLFEAKRDSGKYFPNISFHFIINKLNVDECLKYLDLVKKLSQGMDTSVQFTRMLHYFDEVKHLYTDVSPELVEQINDKAERIGLRVEYNANTPLIKPDINQCREWIMPFIFASGHIIPCCAQNEGNRREYQKSYAMGNLNDNSLSEIWHGSKYKDLRQKIRQNNVPKACLDCPLYTVGGKR